MKFRLPYIELGEFVVMPNHVHGILILDGDMDLDDETTKTGTKTNPKNINIEMSGISPKTGAVSTIIRSYKSAVTKYCNRLELPFGWQSRFHDHIIGNDQSFQRISEYIRNNPANWDEDRLKYSDLEV